MELQRVTFGGFVLLFRGFRFTDPCIGDAQTNLRVHSTVAVEPSLHKLWVDEITDCCVKFNFS